MEQEHQHRGKRHLIELMQAGQPWQQAAASAELQVSRSTAYRWLQAFRTRGEAALQDGRHGHPAKVLPPVLHWLESRCQATSLVASSHLQEELQEQLGVLLSISHLNAIRAAHGWSNAASHAEKKSEKRGNQRGGGSRRAGITGSRP
jgi:transposase